VEGSAVNFSAVAADELLRAAEHFLRGSSREREKKNSFRLYSTIYQVRNSIYESSGLACARAGDDEKRAVAVGCSSSLLGIQICGQILIGGGDESLASGINTNIRHLP